MRRKRLPNLILLNYIKSGICYIIFELFFFENAVAQYSVESFKKVVLTPMVLAMALR